MKRYITVHKFIGLVLLLMMIAGISLAQQAAAPTTAADPAAAATVPAPGSAISQESFMWFLLILVGILMLVVLVMIIGTLLAIDYFFREKYGHSFLPVLPAPQMGNLWARISGSKPVSKNADKALGHEYDGIVELDNAAPPIFNYILWGTILYAVIYLLVFHVFDLSPLQDDEYKEEMRVAKIEQDKRLANAKDNITADNVAVLTAETDLAKGKEIFETNCVACHGDKAQGANGPNLTDKHWIHGGGIKNVFTTITTGVQGKMQAWEKTLKPMERAQVASYVLSLPYAKGKEPEGEEWQEEPKAEEAKADSTKTGAAKETDGKVAQK